jgi:hypothetical protein
MWVVRLPAETGFEDPIVGRFEDQRRQTVFTGIDHGALSVTLIRTYDLIED